MEIEKKKVGRPRKVEKEKVVKINTSYDPDNFRYIMQIIEERKLEKRGNFVKIVNEIIKDHKAVRRYKDMKLSAIDQERALLEPPKKGDKE